MCRLMRLGLMLWVLAQIGCATDGSGATTEGYPARFSLTLLIEDVDGRRLFLVEPNRTLRAATGEGVHAELYPPRTAKLTHAQMAALWRAVAAEPGPVRRLGQEVWIERREPRDHVDSPMVTMLHRWAGL